MPSIGAALMDVRTLRGVNLAGYVLLIVVNVLSGSTNGEISAKYETPLTPSGFAFAGAWTTIFALQLVSVVSSLLPQLAQPADATLRLVGYGWFAGWLSQNLWQWVFAQDTLAGMWVCFILLLAAFSCFWWTAQRLTAAPKSWLPRLFATATSINAAWLSVASCLGLLVALRATGRSYEALIPLGVVLAVAATGLGMAQLLLKRDVAYAATLMWAFFALAVRPGVVPVVQGTAWGAVALLALMAMWVAVRPMLLRRPGAATAHSSSKGAAGGTAAPHAGAKVLAPGGAAGDDHLRDTLLSPGTTRS